VPIPSVLFEFDPESNIIARTFSEVSVAIFKAVLRALKVAPGAKAAAVPTRREAIASFMVISLVVVEMNPKEARNCGSFQLGGDAMID
jgi:hypothetical protein